MKRNQDYEQEIDLIDLLFYLAARWRSIIAAALIGALLLGGFRFLQVMHKNENSDKFAELKARYEEDAALYDQAVEEFDEMIRVYHERIQERTDYKNNSIRMQVDPHHEWVASKSYFVQMASEALENLPELIDHDPADVVLNVYKSSVLGKCDPEMMKNLVGADKAEYVAELLAVSPSFDANTITLKVIGTSEEQVQTIMDYFSGVMENEAAQEANKAGKHDLVLVSDDVYIATDSGLSDEQVKLSMNIRDIKTALTKAEADREALEKKGRPEMPAPESRLKKYTAVGFVMGAALIVGVYGLFYLMSGKLHTAEELSQQYNLPVYGTIPGNMEHGKRKRKLLRQKDKVNQETAYQQIAELIQAKYQGKRILLVSTLDAERVQALYAKLCDLLGARISLSLQPDFLKEKESVEKAREADVLLLTEARNESVMAEIDRMGEMLNISGCEVSGCIIL